MINLEKAIEISKKLIESIIFLCESRTKQTYFTRLGKLSFENLMYFMLNFNRKSLQIELDKFFEDVLMKSFTISKQAYSQARDKVSHTAFIKLTDAITKACYEGDTFKRYLGYRLCAIDGSVVGLNNSNRLRQSFGYIENQYTDIAKARAHGLFDIENSHFIATKLAHYRDSERDVAEDLIDKMIELGSKNDLILFDRGYQSKKLISHLETNHVKYVMRVSTQFVKQVNNTKSADEIVKIKYKNMTYEVRVVKFLLDSGEEEKLITNLREDFSLDDFKKLYFKRWGIEIKFDELKNKLQIENFSGDTKEKILQDFYASIYLSNMASLAKTDAETKSKKRLLNKNLKYEYKININLLIGHLKDRLIWIMLEDDSVTRGFLIEKIIRRISKNVVPIRPNRRFPRGRVRAYKYPLNQKSSL